MLLIYLQKKQAFRLPLRPTNTKANMKRGGTENEKKVEAKSSIIIPSNPITRQPRGQLPPMASVEKENKQPVMHAAPHFLCQGKNAKGRAIINLTDSEEKRLMGDISSPYKRNISKS